MSNLFIFKYFNALQLLNIEAIFVTKCVLKFNNSKDVKDNVMGKLVDAFNWYLMCVIPYDKSGSLTEGQSIKVDLPNTAVGEITCVVAYKGEKEGNKVPIILKCGIMNRDVANLRIEDIEIITSNYTGFRISNDAIYEVDGEKGVYILRGDIIQFRKVKILYSTQDYSIIEKVTDDSSYVKQYDTIITEGTDLYDGKVISWKQKKRYWI